ncbi:hypothetical protein I5M32_12925 [Pedobacter sp. SD-b]|uniref:Outer membrane protein beta-barrel domain-containing protein n=1 Tax=Pedobacter segetis TaxID=2793069 RepID=A0ABS1BLU4_9SPHI|nr:hypothetical protein [Pedobacter segetis]MBK0383864.1 hypothetical protein [Pedobacter segetis]
MKEQFDRAIRNHIRDTFGNYNDQMADDGWKKLNEKKRKKRRGLIFWYTLPSGIAAALALIWLLNWSQISKDNSNHQTVIAKNGLNNHHNNEKTTIKDSIYTHSNTVKKPNSIILKTDNQSLANQTIKENLTAYTPINGFKNSKKAQIKTVHTAPILTAQNKENQLETNGTFNYLAVSNVKNSINLINKIDLKEKPIEKIEIAANTNVFEQPDLAQTSYKKNPFANLPQVASKNNLKPVKKDNFKMSIDANTYYSFSEAGVNNALNLGLGLATEFKLTKRLSVNSGILLNRQTTSFNGNEKSTSDFKRTSFSTLAAVPEAQITNAKLIGLDIPLDLKFDFSLGKIKSFITSGISSYSVINEEYINDYSVVNYSITGVRTSNITNKQENPTGSFSYFKFARTINFSFGLLYPVGKKNTISVEPFMKYPISGLGYQDLKIGSGGLSFKLNFGR